MNIVTKIFQQTFWQIIGKIVTSLSTFIILGIVARSYHEEGIGVFTLSLTYLAIFFLFGDFGFNAHVLRESKIEWNKLLGVRLLWSTILVVLAIILLPFLPFANTDFSKAVIFGSLAIIGSGVFISCNLVFQKHLRYDLSVLSSSIGALFYLGSVLFFVQNRAILPSLLFSQSLSWTAVALVSLFLVKRFTKTLFPEFNFNYLKSLVKDSWPIAATLALNVVYFRIDSFIIAFYKSSADVGIYNIAYSVFQSALVLPTFIMNAYYPLMLTSLKGIRLVGLGLLVVASLGTFFTITFAPTVINVLTGGGFFGSVQSLQILSLGFPAFFLSSLLMWLFVSKGKYKSMLSIYTSGLILNLLLNFIYIPQYSYVAASWITVIAEYVILLMQFFVLFGILSA